MTKMKGRNWANWAIGRIEADFTRSADTHLIPVPVPALPDIAIYLKDESSHPTGSLKHRLARSLFLYALCNGWISEGQTIVEASSGSTAVSEAYFARMLGLPFIAVIPAGTATEKITAIEWQGGRCHKVADGGLVYGESARLAAELGGHYMDQFTYAERATDWRGNNNIAESIFAQMAREPSPVPSWIVAGAGTGGTSATLGRYVRYNRHATRICVADPAGSVFHRHWADRTIEKACDLPCRIEGIGRPRVEASFIPDVIDRMEVVADSVSIAAARTLSAHLGKRVGASTGTNMVAVARLATEMAAQGHSGSIVSILCDGGERYASTYYNEDWLEAQGLADPQAEAQIGHFFATGRLAYACKSVTMRCSVMPAKPQANRQPRLQAG
ncbi:PLP-dependent cysteine synthase family protein [Novosphingobium olei]|uniref:L-cysteine desulfhydrase Cds1 n=1 Tax=Novosphingobium olei TaxID=2728851 RepID=A0A7Y0BNY1_9SPHN|nr:PLP-dependent cysteine synthase family protein [Novosphingobium olei]NML93971.1 PLP-dependent cysteine synthase family protein [Novosphingobium olei]